ncbi:MAG: phosphatase PAP2 family protein [Clostridiales Family XIII bacterium]|jgi:hypothetical protein|nr:phosphatase PAP2 family protein [Clostridiales Family XIII bacterium]
MPGGSLRDGGGAPFGSAAKIIGALLVLYALETVSYFYLATWAGQRVGKAGTWNLQLPIDEHIPWIPHMYAYYILWPILWFFVVPLLISLSCGPKGFSRYVANSLLMYVAGSVIYLVFPTTTTEMDFIDGTIQALQRNAPYYTDIYALADSSVNIWGSFPSYHNYWASLLVLFPLFGHAKPGWKILLIAMGGAITLSTLTLHQHCVMDAVLTYAMTAGFYALTVRFKWFEK